MPSADSPRAEIENPWLRAFVDAAWETTVIGQVKVTRFAGGFELRHVLDADVDPTTLKPIRPMEARAWAAFNEAKEFRPLKSKPDLRRFWILRATSQDELGEALNHFYPNALADRFALTKTPPPITNYRPFTARQTGMYRITTFSTDADVARVIAKTCNAVCLKQRLWTVEGLAPDREEAKSLIPCLEPCAILMEAARTEVRALQQAGVNP